MSDTGRFDYTLAEYLRQCGIGDPHGALPILLGLWKRWPEMWHQWVGRHPQDVPDVIRYELHQAGLDAALA